MMKEINYIISIGDCCVVTEMSKNNNTRTFSSIFDWAQSDLNSVCDVVENGLDYHIINNIDNNKCLVPNKQYPYDHIYYPHHIDKNYMKRCSYRFFDILDNFNNILFVYMTHDNIDNSINDLLRFIEIVKNKYIKINFKVISATSSSIYSEDIYLKTVGDFLDIYYCNSPKEFWNNRMDDHVYYKKLFDNMITNKYELKLKK